MLMHACDPSREFQCNNGECVPLLVKNRMTATEESVMCNKVRECTDGSAKEQNVKMYIKST